MGRKVCGLASGGKSDEVVGQRRHVPEFVCKLSVLLVSLKLDDMGNDNIAKSTATDGYLIYDHPSRFVLESS
ncbi:hypothetical protein DM01DRAFT_1196149 [Hesseltinella vesiculosa]|uniref:Uncharacterized protein n=1 Tax=Hesseltinella vesiculosa TaxID=101127 RepID=A0A1X2G3K1_9FUNG|nr:hypothetical protein DM01DRAFT_1196149 [Hesseltinella vesiculosa]